MIVINEKIAHKEFECFINTILDQWHTHPHTDHTKYQLT